MTTFSVSVSGFWISTEPGFPNSRTAGRAAFGIDTFGIPVMKLNIGASAYLGMQGPVVSHWLSPAGTVPTRALLMTVTPGGTSPGGPGQECELLIPQPVGTGATRGVPCEDESGNVFYILCTQTPPT